MNILVPMAGRGSRFLIEKHRNPEYSKPKPLINIAGYEMIKWAISSMPLTGKENIIFLVLKEHVDEHKIDERLRKIFPSCKIIIVDKVTEGAACTALLAREHINNDEPLIITDSDHYIDGASVFKEIERHKGKIDGIIPVFYANNGKWSFSKTNEEGFVIETAEKVQISRNANIGIYYFGKGRDFVWAAEEMIEENDRTNGEFFIAPVYNYMIRRGKGITLARPRFVHGLGTPKDLEKFLVFLSRGEVDTRFTPELSERKNPSEVERGRTEEEERIIKRPLFR